MVRVITRWLRREANYQIAGRWAQLSGGEENLTGNPTIANVCAAGVGGVWISIVPPLSTVHLEDLGSVILQLLPGMRILSMGTE